MSRARRFSLALLALACGCKAGEDYVNPQLELPAAFGAASTLANGAEQPPTRWWTQLEDPLLDSLIERASAANLDLRVAHSRVVEARALLDQTRGVAGPQVAAGAGYTWGETSTNVANGAFADSGPTELFRAGFDAFWELDVFGRNARAIEAAHAGAQAAEEARRDVLVSLCAEVAFNYVELRAAQREESLTRANLAAQEDTLGLVRARARAQMSSDFDVARAEGQAATTRALMPQFEVRASQAIHRIGVLLGVEPNALAPELSTPAPIPASPPVAATGIPSDLLRRRADMRRAERELAQAAALTAQATAELFPRLSLSAALGLEADSLGKLFEDGSGTFVVSPNLSAPLFNSGALRAAVRVQGARQEQALALYEQSALVALREVEDALVAQDRERTRLEALREAFAAADTALELSREMNREGLADFFEVLAAQRDALNAESAVARSEAELCAGTIAVYKALGGGWEN